MSMFRNLIMVSGGGSILPPAYQQVEYIEGTGTQYINTNFVDAGNTDYEMQFELTTFARNYQMYIGGYRNQPAFPKLFASGDQFSLLRIQSSSDHTFNVAPGIRYSIKIEGSILTFNNTTLSLTRGSGKDAATTIYVFNCYSEPNLISAMKLYSLKMYDNGVKVRDLVPCYRKSDNEIGLYDIVNNVFYTNAGTGTFIKGPNV